MIKLNEEIIELNKYPDGTFMFKNIPFVRYNHKNLIEWYFEHMEELPVIIYIAKYCLDYKAKLNLFMPYIPDARMDRVKSETEVFTLKYFAQTINSLGFSKVTVLDPHSDVSAALFDRLNVESPKTFIEEAVKKVGNKNLMMFYPDSGAMKRYSSMVHLPYAFGIKNRDWESGEIKGLDLSGEISQLPGKDVLIVDDICSRGGADWNVIYKIIEKELANYEVELWKLDAG